MFDDERRAAIVGLVEEENGTLLRRVAEDGRDVLGRLTGPHRLHLGVAHDQQ